MADYRAFLSNCFIGGAECTETPNGGRIRNLIRFEMGGYQMELRQDPEIIRGDYSKLKGRFVRSTEVVVREVKPSNVKKVGDLMRVLSELLSFATMSPVIFYAEEYPDGSGHGASWSVIGAAQFFRPTLNISDGKLIATFVEQTWRQYKRLRVSRKLNIAVALIVEADTAPKPVELQLLSVFVALENLKYTFAKARNIPHVKGYFRKPATKFGKIGRPYKFEELMAMMFKEVKMKPSLKKIIRLRNHIIHSALTSLSQSSQDKIYDKCHDIVREYLLRLLGYSGEFASYASRNSKML